MLLSKGNHLVTQSSNDQNQIFARRSYDVHDVGSLSRGGLRDSYFNIPITIKVLPKDKKYHFLRHCKQV